MEENPVPQGEIPYQKTYDCLIHIRHALALDAPRPQPALALLEKLIQSDRTQARNGRLLTTWVLKARALFLAHAPGKAVKALEQALALAAPQGYVRIFVSELADLTRHQPRIQKTIQGAQLPPDFARALEDGLTQRPCRVSIHDMVEEFNTREIAILKLFGRGLSNKEAASQLSLSVNTIRWYAARIFAKLYVNRRGQAVARARELGLIP